MKNFKNYAAEKYSDKAKFEEIEQGIYKTLNPYEGYETEEIYVTSLSFEQEPELPGEEGGSPRNITQTPFESLLDEFSVYVTDFYDAINEKSEITCYQEFGSDELEDIKNLRSMIGKRIYAETYMEEADEDDEDSEPEECYRIVIK
ncbi:MAG: hypothetical protein LBV04_06720 [Deferribacteraceae bacterium]|nr:hypothetical protein [Deferribacteraceae bacterium]